MWLHTWLSWRVQLYQVSVKEFDQSHNMFNLQMSCQDKGSQAVDENRTKIDKKDFDLSNLSVNFQVCQLQNCQLEFDVSHLNLTEIWFQKKKKNTTKKIPEYVY